MLRRIMTGGSRPADKHYAIWVMGAVSFAERLLSGASRYHAAYDRSRGQAAWLFATQLVPPLSRGRLLGYAIGAVPMDSVGNG